jgi:hypothetical protein
MAKSKSDFTKSKRYTYTHVTHTTTFDGSETQHVKSDFTASIDGSYVVKADAISLSSPFILSASAYAPIVSASVISSPDLGIKGANDGFVKIWDRLNATHGYIPYWNRTT